MSLLFRRPALVITFTFIVTIGLGVVITAVIASHWYDDSEDRAEVVEIAVDDDLSASLLQRDIAGFEVLVNAMQSGSYVVEIESGEGRTVRYKGRHPDAVALSVSQGAGGDLIAEHTVMGGSKPHSIEAFSRYISQKVLGLSRQIERSSSRVFMPR